MALNQKGVDQNNKESFIRERYHSARCEHKSTHYHPHWHDYIELLYVKKGCLRVTLRNTKLLLKENELLVIMPGELHSTEYDGESVLEYSIIVIDSTFFHDTAFDSIEFSKNYHFFFSSRIPQFYLCSSDDIEKAGIQPVIDNLYSEYKNKKQGYTLSIRADLLKIFVWLLRRQDINPSTESETNNFSIKRILPVLEIIKEKIGRAHV